MRRTSGGGRKLFSAIEARNRAVEINIVHGTTLVLEGGGPIQIMTIDRMGHRTRLSPWMTRQNAIIWLDAFELGIVHATRGPDAAVDIVKKEGGEN